MSCTWSALYSTSTRPQVSDRFSDHDSKGRFLCNLWRKDSLDLRSELQVGSHDLRQRFQQNT
eukprot:3374845-Amphidinium_carterae.3